MSETLLIRCHGRCQAEKSPWLFWVSDMQKLRLAQAAGASYRPVCRQCRMDRAKKIGLYATTDFAIERPKPKPSGWVFRRDAASLCPGSAAASAAYDQQMQLAATALPKLCRKDVA